MEGISPEQQIQELRAEYEKKIAEIQNRAAESGETSPESSENVEHRAVSEVAEQMIQKAVPEFKASSHEPGRTGDGLPEEARNKIQEWINIAAENPYRSVQAAKDSGDIALIDAFHGALTSDEIFPEMIKRGKLELVK